ncbi:HAD family hydrolase [Nocardia asteroides]|uniref:HAD family hydrolase n=1 Tax=Nocardia asteroides TaxID=1824 RepID=UPI001E3A8E97|nr:HAD hydrolase-like protein [Nocardia asteroides]UGT56039.1 HAD hydrolase-like protein [Nocardia asteroides]
MTITVGFDLDMTLIDSRPGVSLAIDTLAGEFDLPIVGSHFAAHLGPPLATLLGDAGAPDDLIPHLVTRYRQLYPAVITRIPALPGASAALDAVRAGGGRALVVTGKFEPHARLHVDHFGWQVDRLAGDLWSTGKADVLRAESAHVFVGDHAGDMRGAKAADAFAVGVTTGPYDADGLRAAGADVVLDDLVEFPSWLAEFARTRG